MMTIPTANSLDSRNAWLEKAFFTFILIQFLLVFLLSMKRVFNFDEFQVLYASAALLRGEALYADHIGTHFPLANLFFSFLLKLYGFKVSFLFVARIAMVLCIALTLFYTYKITYIFTDRLTALLAVALAMSSLAFVNKGIEIRHDVFNMMFNTMGAFYGIRYLIERKIAYLLAASIFLGMALASTQKAVIWNLGIMIGIFIALLKTRKGLGEVLKPFMVLAVWLMPLLLSIVLLITFCNETIQGFLDVAIWDRIGYLDITKKSAYPFLNTRASILSLLIRDNGAFYLVSIFGIGYLLIKKKGRALSYVLILWALFGILFYLTMKRPFYQSFLPTIPVLGIAAAIFLGDLVCYMSRFKPVTRKLTYIALILLMFFFPTHKLLAISLNPESMSKQLQTISFCLDHLKPEDRVLCFSQQQIFFSPIFSGLQINKCGNTIYSMAKDCTIQEMIAKECKVVIYDHRTRFLKDEIQKEIHNHYINTGIGNIFVPGFTIPPMTTVDKSVWISGPYFVSSIKSLNINGKRIEEKINTMRRGAYKIENDSKEPVTFMYAFPIKK